MKNDTIFSQTNVEYLQLRGSDHRPLLASIQNNPYRPYKHFIFHKRWIDKPGFKESVQEGWLSPLEERKFRFFKRLEIVSKPYLPRKNPTKQIRRSL